MVAATLDARGDIPAWSDVLARYLGIGLEIAAAVVFVRRAEDLLPLQSQVLTRPAGVAATVIAFLGGLAFLVATLNARRRRIRWPAVLPGLALFVATLFFFTLLMPSPAGYTYLFRIAFRQPEAMALSGTVSSPGVFERWYQTDLGRADAIDLVKDSFRSPPVSVWATDGGGAKGNIFGYRIGATFFSRGSRLPHGADCSTEFHGCVRMAVARSDNWD